MSLSAGLFNPSLETGTVYLVLSNTFKEYCMKTLFKKQGLGIRDNIYKILEKILGKRYQIVILKKPFSSWVQSKEGVPKGANLGPLLLFIYKNDIFVGLPSSVKM